MPEGYNGAYTGQQIDEGIAKANAALPAPTGGTAGQVLKKTETGAEWGDVDGGLTQEDADDRYLQLTGGTVDGTLQIGTGESSSSTTGKLFLADYNPNIVPGRPKTISLEIIDYFSPAEEGSITSAIGAWAFQFSDPIMVLKNLSGCSLVVSGTINGVQDPVYSVDAANKRYVDSKIPKSRTVTLSASGWSSNSQTVTVSGILSDETKQLIQPCPAMASQSAYYSAGIMCTGQAADSLTFTCQTVPTENLTVYVAYQEVGT